MLWNEILYLWYSLDEAIRVFLGTIGGIGAGALLLVLLVLIWRTHRRVLSPVRESRLLANNGAGKAMSSVVSRAVIIIILGLIVPGLWVALLENLSGQVAFDPFLEGLPEAILTAMLFRQFVRIPRIVVGEGGMFNPSHVNINPLIQIAQVVIGLIGLVAVLDSLGQNVGAAVALGGIVTAALALASQSTASNLVCFFTLLIEGKFSIGDTIRVYTGVNGASVEGIIQDMGLISTALMTDEGLLAIPNKTFSSSPTLRIDSQEDIPPDEAEETEELE